jgi:hypothetical protein
VCFTQSGRLYALVTKVSLGWNCLPETNTLAYYVQAKSFIKLMRVVGKGKGREGFMTKPI